MSVYTLSEIKAELFMRARGTNPAAYETIVNHFPRELVYGDVVSILTDMKWLGAQVLSTVVLSLEEMKGLYRTFGEVCAYFLMNPNISHEDHEEMLEFIAERWAYNELPGRHSKFTGEMSEATDPMVGSYYYEKPSLDLLRNVGNYMRNPLDHFTVDEMIDVASRIGSWGELILRQGGMKLGVSWYEIRDLFKNSNLGRMQKEMEEVESFSDYRENHQHLRGYCSGVNAPFKTKVYNLAVRFKWSEAEAEMVANLSEGWGEFVDEFIGKNRKVDCGFLSCLRPQLIQKRSLRELEWMLYEGCGDENSVGLIFGLVVLYCDEFLTLINV